jgi:hypothetical protein
MLRIAPSSFDQAVEGTLLFEDLPLDSKIFLMLLDQLELA